MKARKTKSSIIWGIMPCSPYKANRRFGRTCRLHLQDIRIFYLEDGGRFPGNIAKYLLKYITSLLRKVILRKIPVLSDN
jgi:hypothetical protein